MFVHHPQPRAAGRQTARGSLRRSLTLATAFMAAGMLSLSVAAGAASASPTTASAATASAAGVTWHKLSLINGWMSGQNYHAGDPSWAVKNGIVYLSGSIRQTAGSNNEAAVLPKAARPAHSLYLTVHMLDRTIGYVGIFRGGQLTVSSSVVANAQGFTSLAGISFPAASITGLKLALVNGWQSSQGAWGTGDPSYAIRGGVVYLSGALHRPSGSEGIFARLPRAARPARL